MKHVYVCMKLWSVAVKFTFVISDRVEAGNCGQTFFVLYNFLLLTAIAVYHYQLFTG